LSPQLLEREVRMSDDEVMDEGELEGEILADPELEGEGLDEDSLELDIEEDDLLVDGELADGAEVEDPDAIVEEVPVARKAKGEEDEEDEEDLRTEDDVEADLDAILREKLTAAEESPLEEDEEDVVVDDKTDGMERLQPRRPDETQCTQCFLLVRNSAPGCPVEDDACPLFK
ncbi:MAG: hypothetical protein ACO24S_08280, partial [Ilumatobacteraceae bacterium]